MKKAFLYFIFLIISSSLACGRWNLDELDFASVETGSTVEVTANAASVTGSISGDFDLESVSAFGHFISSEEIELSTIDTTTLTSFRKTDASQVNDFITKLDNLNLNTIYYYVAFAIINSRVFYGLPRQFVTNEIRLGESEIQDILLDEIQVAGTIFGLEGEDIIISNHGHCWSLEGELPIYGMADCSDLGMLADDGIFFSNLSGLMIGKNYNIRSFARFQDTLLYGEVSSINISNVWELKETQAPISSPFLGFALDKEGVELVYVVINRATDNVRTYNTQDNTWSLAKDFPGEQREDAVSFVIDNKGYIGLGRKDSGVPLTDIWEYNADRNEWQQLENYPDRLGKFNTSVFVIDTTAYISAGSNFQNRYTRDLWAFTPKNNSWMPKKPLPRFSASRYDATSFSIGTNGYLLTGITRGTIPPENFPMDVWEYNALSDEWNKIRDFDGIGRANAISFSIDNKGYIGLGSDKELEGLRDCYVYDPNTGWDRIANFGGQGSFSSTIIGFAGKKSGYVLIGKSLWKYVPNQ